MSINPYLKHTVSISRVTNSGGERTTVVTSGVDAFIVSRHRTVRDAYGDHLESDTVVFLKPDQAIDENDEILIDDRYRPVKKIRRARDMSGIHHLEVELG